MTIVRWVVRSVAGVCPPDAKFEFQPGLTLYGYVQLRDFNFAIDRQTKGRIDEILDAGRRASEGCCLRCGQAGAPIVEGGWLTSLCDDCCGRQLPLSSRRSKSCLGVCNHAIA